MLDLFPRREQDMLDEESADEPVMESLNVTVDAISRCRRLRTGIIFLCISRLWYRTILRLPRYHEPSSQVCGLTSVIRQE